jgi:hypothetical protein
MRRVLGIAVLCGVGLLVLWFWAFPTYAYRYRLTLAIEVDGQVHTGSSVIEIRWIGQPNIGPGGSSVPRVYGQAVLIDLGTRGVVVATLNNGESYGPASDGAKNALWLAAQAFGNRSTAEEMPALPHLRGRRELTPDNMPRLVWFPDIAVPQSARKFTAAEIPTLFGNNSHLVSAYVEITSNPLVIDIDKTLPWIDTFTNATPGGVLPIEDRFGLAKEMFIGESS